MVPFTSIPELRRHCSALPAGDESAAQAITCREAELTKPPGSLGRLEELVVWCGRWQRRNPPRLDRPAVLVFAGNHGVAAHGVSAYPSAVTAQMVANFAAGGAAINQLARRVGASLTVVPLELERPTADFTSGPAMSEAETGAAIGAG